MRRQSKTGTDPNFAMNTSSRNRTTSAKLGSVPGFTLIEVLVVVAILGILAAIVVPRIMDRPDEA